MIEFGLLYTASQATGGRAPKHRLFREAVDAARLAEDHGFDRFYVHERGLTGGWPTLAPEVALGAIAVTTSVIRLAYGFVCVPSGVNHPARVAERAATIDNLSDGRLDVTVGIMPSAHTYPHGGVSPEAARAEFVDAVRAIVELWTEGETDFGSDRLNIAKRRNAPSLVQHPHPNLMMACTATEPPALAGDYGLGVVFDGVAGADRVPAHRRQYDAAIAARRPEGMVAEFPFDHFTVAVPGRPHEGIEITERLVQAGVDEVLFVCDRSELAHNDALETIRSIGGYVIPHFRRAGAPASATQSLAG